jgi:hypothetical protein
LTKEESLPSFTDPVHQRAAHQRSVEVRRSKRDVKLGLKTGRMSLGQALGHPAVQSMRVADLVGCCLTNRNWNPGKEVTRQLTRAEAVCRSVQMSLLPAARAWSDSWTRLTASAWYPSRCSSFFASPHHRQRSSSWPQRLTAR